MAAQGPQPLTMPTTPIPTTPVAMRVAVGASHDEADECCIVTAKKVATRALNNANKYLNGVSWLNFEFQETLDEAGNATEAHLEKIFVAAFGVKPAEAKAWLEKVENQPWYLQVLIFMGKTALLAIFNIFSLIYTALKTTATTLAHPLNAIISLGHFIVNALYSLTEPETWSSMGAAMLGVCLGAALVMGSFSGATFLIGFFALIIGCILGLAFSDDQALTDQFVKLFERFLTGFILGLVIGAIVNASQASSTQASTSSHQDMKMVSSNPGMTVVDANSKAYELAQDFARVHHPLGYDHFDLVMVAGNNHIYAAINLAPYVNPWKGWIYDLTAYQKIIL